MRRRALLRLLAALAPAVLAALAVVPASATGGLADGPTSRAGASRAASAEPQPLLVFAAASLTDALKAIGPAYTRATGEPVTFSFAASSTLARQIVAGAQADVFFSADTDWMDFLAAKHLIDPRTRRDIVGNRLALIAPAGSPLAIAIRKGFDLAGALGPSGRLAVAEPDSVPAGRYARDALRSLGVWQSVSRRLIPAENVRAALEYVARGEAPLGIVYETDALIEPRVRIVGIFPAASHPPITYPAAVVVGTHAGPRTGAAAGPRTGAAARPLSGEAAGAERFVRFLTAPEAQRIFHKLGFRAP